MKDYTMENCRDFAALLASDCPAPGGGGAAALTAAMGAALGGMVGALTMGKKSYAPVEEEIKAAMTELEALRLRLLDMVQADAKGFEPLAAAYKLPKDTPDRDAILESATLRACQAPMEMMDLCCRALEQMAVMAEKGSKMAVSDAGCGAALLKAGLDAAALNVYINTKSLQDREEAQRINAACRQMQQRYGAQAEKIYRDVETALLR
ncbi:MAG: cyclodeaminase/cyclohydrolase family protein [Candidatus Limivicinus sp.]